MSPVEPLSFLVRLAAPDVDPAAFNDWRFVTTTLLAPWATVALLVGLAVAGLLPALLEFRVLLRRRLLLAGLRMLAGGLVLGLFLRPALELRSVSRVRTRVPVLIDASRSMALPARQGTRAEAVAQHLLRSRSRIEDLSQRAVLEPALFGSRLQPLRELPDSYEPTEPVTDLAGALREATNPSAGREIGAVLIYSDGADNQGLGAEDADRLAAELGAPLYIVGFDQGSSGPDLAISRVISDDFAFVHNRVTFEVEVTERGLGLERVDVTLRQDGSLMQTKEVRLSEGRGRAVFEFKPRLVGKPVYHLSVPVQDGEVITGNNERTIVLKVIRDRIRILQVAGRPSWDQRFLREHLKRNPSIDLISFFILRSPTDLQDVPQEELALIPFPVNELFTTELGSFDIVIYQNFSYRPYNMAQYLRNVRDYVDKGGSFLMIGGENSFEDGHYAGTPIEEILPLRLGGALGYDRQSYRPRLTSEGARHPILQIAEPGEPMIAALARLPPLRGLNASSGLVPGAQALLVHPGLPGAPPVVAVAEVGAGMSMAIATDSLWLWRFAAAEGQGAGREFDRFFSQTLRWLTKDPELARVRVQADRSAFAVDHPVRAEIRVLGADYQGLPEAAATVRLIEGPPPRVPGPRGEARSGDAARREAHVAPAPRLAGGAERAVEVQTGADGRGVVVFDGVPPGTYHLEVEATSGGEPIGEAREPVIVEGVDLEWLDPSPRPELTQALADKSGGTFVDIQQDLPTIRLRDPRRVEVARARRIPVWNTWLAVGALVLVVGTEWWVRRRSGLL